MAIGRAAPEAPINCPEGTLLKGDPPPKGKTLGCESSDGVKEGPFRVWHTNGTLAEEGSYLHGKLNGKMTSWSAQGKKLAEGDYAEGELQGLWRRWHPSGDLKDEGRWENGVPAGEWTTYYPNGKRESRGEFLAGEKACFWTYWDSSGAESRRMEAETPSCKRGSADRGFDWAVFQTGFNLIFQGSSGGSVYSWLLLWNPTYRFSSRFSLRGSFGGSLLKIKNGSSFLVLDMMVGPYLPGLIYLPGGTLGIEILGGTQTWVGQGGTYPAVRSTFSWELQTPLFNWVDRFTVSYAIFIASEDPAHQITLGLGLKF